MTTRRKTRIDWPAWAVAFGFLAFALFIVPALAAAVAGLLP